MARGWESKSVESQIEQAEQTRSAGPPPGAEEREADARRRALELDRARLLQQLQTACNPRYRGQLEAALAHIDAQLSAR